MSHALLAIRNILQNSNIFILSRETVLFTPFGKKKVTQFSGFPPTSVSYLKWSAKLDTIRKRNKTVSHTLVRPKNICFVGRAAGKSTSFILLLFM